MLPQHQQDTNERQDLKIEPKSCFSDLSDSLNLPNSLNSMGVLLHLRKTQMWSVKIMCSFQTLSFCHHDDIDLFLLELLYTSETSCTGKKSLEKFQNIFQIFTF